MTTMPAEAEVLQWYRCGRKQRLASEGVAGLAAAAYPGTSYYPCGNHWHIGRTPTSGRWTIPHARRAWKRTHP